ncbi:MAG: PIN domain-containing protein [bacterium]|nr:PIN domain-containing protein [bacterium]
MKKHTNNILVDTNILVYAIDEDSKFYYRSRELLLNSNHNLFTTSKNLSEFLTVVTRSSVTFLPIEEALAAVGDFINVLTVLYPTEGSFAIFRELLRKYKSTGLKIHDFEIISIGLWNKIDQIATINYRDFDNIQEIKLIIL